VSEETILEPDGGRARERLHLDELERHTGLRRATLLRLVRLGLIEPVRTEPEPVFELGVLVRVLRIQRLRRDLSVGLSSMGLVLDLLERVERLERELGRR
jgi:hypothetical protein